MKFLRLILFILSFVIVGCNQKNKLTNNESDYNNIAINTNGESLKLLQQNCYACHSVTSKSHEEIIAPPMVAVVNRYKMSYQTKEEFVEAITEWVINPNEENALMRGAVINFNVMPLQQFNRDDVIKIANYMYDNELEQPSWFKEHFNEEHSKRMGNGNGNRWGNGW